MVVSIKTEDQSISSLVEDAKKSLDDGRLPFKMISDPRIFELEVERLWRNVWHFFAHESEIALPGDYVVRHIGPYDSIIVCRDEAGKVNAFMNICAHRGTKLCRADMGNTSYFRCIYHGWTYNTTGKLVGVPFKKEAFGDYDVLSKYGLVPVRVDSYNGLIFGNLSGKAKPLSDYLADFKWYLDIFTARTDTGIEFYPPLRQVARFNWKIAVENLATDTYHIPTTHRANVAVGQFSSDVATEMLSGYQTCISGHTLCFSATSSDIVPISKFQSHPLSFRNSPKPSSSSTNCRKLERIKSLAKPSPYIYDF